MLIFYHFTPMISTILRYQHHSVYYLSPMKFADVAKQSRVSEVSPIAAGGPGPAQGPQKLWGF